MFPAAEAVVVEEVADPVCKPDEVVVRVRASGLCGTDLHIFRNEYSSRFPLIPGHEISGEVCEVGRDVTGLKIDDRVAVDPNLDCGQCYFYRNQQNNHCLNWQGVGVTQQALHDFAAGKTLKVHMRP